jgi:dTDP-glucose 4,6-dehydratase/UDP-glucuronate decarboxylase
MTNSQTIEDIDLNYIQQKAHDVLSHLSNSRLLLTGGAGFLGYYITKIVSHWNRYSSQKISLTLLDNFALGCPAWIKTLDKEIKLVTLDISQAPLSHLINHDYIMHAASIASPIFYRKHPITTIRANVFGLHQLLEAMTTNKDCQALLFFSTSEIYGNPESHAIPTPESYPGRVSCTGPRACYDESKRFGETLCVNYHKEYNLPIKVVRPFNNYGPGLSLKDKRVVSDFANNILNQEDITLFSNGNSTRTFCYIADAVVGFLKTLVYGLPGEAYNIGNDTPEVSMHELAKIMRHVAHSSFNYTGKIQFTKHQDTHYLTDNPERRCPDLTKAKTHFGYHPSIDLQEGLRRALTWYQEKTVTI